MAERDDDYARIMGNRDEDFATIYWRMRLQLAGCMAFIVLVCVLAGLAIGWLSRH